MKALKVERYMNDKELLLLEAIDNYDVYTSIQARVLKTFINISVDDIAIISPAKLAEMMLTTKTTIYNAINKLQKDGSIKVLKEKGEKCHTFKLNRIKLNDIVLGYQKRISLL